MKFPRWAVLVVLRFLSVAGLTSAAGGDKALCFGLGFALSPATGFPTTEALSQPQLDGLSLDVDFFVQFADHEYKVPIMPLHLLGKKSWNVYNADNVEKVKRDEAAAKAAEEAEEQRMQELDAERRIQILRGEIPTPLPIEDVPSSTSTSHEHRSEGSGRERKRRKKAGENDTDFELRVARENQASAPNTKTQLVLKKENNAPLTDHKGHISLFPSLSSQPPVEKNEEAEKETAKKKREYEDQFTMRFSNAAGFKQGLEDPWYSKRTGGEVEAADGVVGRDVWGNEDPRRRDREAKRVVDNDPLALMKKGAAQVRQVERERKRWREEKQRELRELEEADKSRKRKRKHSEDDDGLENFTLDGPDKSSSRRHEREREHSRRHRHSSRSSHGEERRHKHRHRGQRHDD